jgi:hypothetical protein
MQELLAGQEPSPAHGDAHSPPAHVPLVHCASMLQGAPSLRGATVTFPIGQ